MAYYSRGDTGLPAPHNNDGTTLRPLLPPGLHVITVHYPGAPVGRTFADLDTPDEQAAYLRAVQRSAATVKSYEYNYLIFQTGDVLEYAGDHLAAHSAGENAESYGVQMVNGQDELCTDAQVVAFRWLRDVHLKGRGRLAADARTVPHRDMPGAATACPGDRAIMPRMDDLRAPYVTPAPPQEDDMASKWLIQLGGSVWVTDGVTRRGVAPVDIDKLRFLGQVLPGEPVPMTQAEVDRILDVSPGVFAAMLTTGGRPPSAVEVAVATANELARRVAS